MKPRNSKTDWERIKRAVVADAPVLFDPAVDPYDPNDAAAVDAFWKAATVRRPGQRGAQRARAKPWARMPHSR